MRSELNVEEIIQDRTLKVSLNESIYVFMLLIE